MMKCENMKPYRGKVLLSVFIYALLLESCTGENYAPELTEVEAFIQAKSDSALRCSAKSMQRIISGTAETTCVWHDPCTQMAGWNMI